MIYLDTGCLLKLYYPEPESRRVATLVAGEPLVLTALHELEIRNALELKVFRREATAIQARKTAALLEADARQGVLHRPAVAWTDALLLATEMARKHTRSIGCRSLDVLHCAAAQALSANSFVTTDARQRRLALAVGLPCPKV